MTKKYFEFKREKERMKELYIDNQDSGETNKSNEAKEYKGENIKLQLKLRVDQLPLDLNNQLTKTEKEALRQSITMSRKYRP